MSSPPAGKVTFDTAALGTFDHKTCTLKKKSSSEASCDPHFTPKRPGLMGLRSSYSGDAKHGGSQENGSASGRESEKNSVVAGSLNTVRIGVKMTCTMTVRDVGGAQLSTPTGKVRIATAAIGTFDHNKCTLKKTSSIAASCAVHLTPKRSGQIGLRSSYSGDAKHGGSQ